MIACCVLPLGWMLVQLARHPGSASRVVPTVFYAGLLARTLSYSVGVALLATILALPAALALGRSRGQFAAVLWFLLPAALLMPSITYAYGWSQFLRLLDLTPALDTKADVLRCIATLATWLWPIPAGVIALGLRRVDADVQQQALLDGALWRLTARQLAGPAAAGMACVIVLASQEFAVYEPTGISVVATEVRMVFETGAFSSPDNPITAAFIGGGGAAAWVPPSETSTPDASDTPADSSRINGTQSHAPAPSIAVTPAQPWATVGRSDQDARAASAVATSLPLLLVAAVFGVLGVLGVRRVSATTEELHTNETWPRALEAGMFVKVLAVFVVMLTLCMPAGAMIASLHVHPSPIEVWHQFSPQATGSIILAFGAAVVAAIVAFASAVRGGTRSAVWISLAAFLIGGQLLAIALIRLYNRPAPWPLGLVTFGGAGGFAPKRDLFDLIYNGAPIVVMAYLARFGWLALLAGNLTRTSSWRQVRELVALDGATPAQAARHVVWPLAWPVLAASAILVGVLALTEVPATVLISPLRPQPLIPMLMGWVHMVRYDEMILGSLLLMSMALVLSLSAAGLIALGMRFVRPTNSVKLRPTIAIVGLGVFGLCVASGCSDPKQPKEMWLETGTAPGQVVYPRAITYSPKDDSYFVVDRLARIQHINDKGEAIGGWRMPDWRIGKPVGLSVGPDGNVYVPDTHYDRVIVYTPDGKEIRRWGSRGTEPGQFIWPTDVAFDKSGNVYVSEYGDHDRIQVFAPDGKFLRQFGSFGDGPGQFMRPQSMVIDGDMLYVTDSCNHRISVWKTDGTFVRNFGSPGSALGQFRFPYGLDEDKQGRLVVCEFGNSRVQLVDKETGKGLEIWGMPGRDPGQFAYPWAAVVNHAGQIVAVDSGNNRVQVFEF